MKNKSKHIIKKYQNRRLYDTLESKYITLGDIRQMIVEEAEFCVKDAQTDEDITRSVLLQIIAKQEQQRGENDGEEPLFSTDSLSNLVRFYSKSVNSSTAGMLESNIELMAKYMEMQKKIQCNVASEPLKRFNDIAECNFDLLQKMQQDILGATVGMTPEKKKKEE
ncbi:MAG: polyhydroxyalkanoate synthesis repressor PhaR [Candidatus Eutrophobiaceae bacterium]